MQPRATLTSPRASAHTRATATLLLQRRSGSAAVWACSFCGCARNTSSDVQCRLCKRRAGHGHAELRSSLAPARARAEVLDAADNDPLEGITAKIEAERKAAAIRRVLNTGTHCVVCYEVTMDGTYCCGQPLCCSCASNLQSADCPYCRQKLQHRRAPKQKPTSSVELFEEELEARGGGIDLVGLLHDATTVMVSEPPAASLAEDKYGDTLPQLTRLRQQSALELPNYVDYVVGYAGSLRSSASRSPYVMETRLELLIEEIYPVVDRHLEEIEKSSHGKVVALRQFERLKRHGLLQPAHLARVEAL